MRHGFVKVAAVTPDIIVADVDHNKEEIEKRMRDAAASGAKIIVFPELCLTGYTCADLFVHPVLLSKTREAIFSLAEATKELDALVFVGMPFMWEGKLYNTAAALWGGRLLGLTTKTFLPNYGEFYEMRQFTAGPDRARLIEIEGRSVWFGPGLLYTCTSMEGLAVFAEICEDVWSPVPPSIAGAIAGATVIANCSASDETIGKARYRRDLICGQSARLMAGYIYANAGEGESTTDVVFGGHSLIAENGVLLREARRFENGMIVTELDIHRLLTERQKNTTFHMEQGEGALQRIPFFLKMEETYLTRTFDRMPFVPDDNTEKDRRCEEILQIQAMGLKKRLAHTRASAAVVGISGGLDSTLALLVTARAFDALGRSRREIVAVTMPCFGTTDRTYNNACEMARRLGATLMEIPIAEAVRVHLRDIGHDEADHSVTYENAQARERMQVLMDVANRMGGLVVGTGDLSELALGWATYNGDHMSMYGVNGSVPKTLVRHLVAYVAEHTKDKALADILWDVLDTPVSPELLPPKDGDIAQRTEDIVGPYELHDFFLYYMLRFSYSPGKIYRIARLAFAGEYGDEVIARWLETFCRRFFSQQFKRSCLPDGPKVGMVAISPRGDLRMPSDASAGVWLEDLAQEIKRSKKLENG